MVLIVRLYDEKGILFYQEVKLNITAVGALLAGIIIVFATQFLEGGSAAVLFQPSAFFIVIGGTFCASLLTETFNSFCPCWFVK